MRLRHGCDEAESRLRDEAMRLGSEMRLLAKVVKQS